MDGDVEKALLKAIQVDPDNDLPRLVYCDFLRENGHDSWANFIQLQVEGEPVALPLGMLAMWHPELCNGMKTKVALDYRTKVSSVTITSSGPGTANGGPSLRLEWRRGFVDSVSGPFGWVAGVTRRLVGRHPIRRIDALDKAPMQSLAAVDGWFGWTARPGFGSECTLPDGVFDCLSRSDFRTHNDAMWALSDAIVKWARRPTDG